jgi:hypothetical protein
LIPPFLISPGRISAAVVKFSTPAIWYDRRSPWRTSSPGVF